MEAKGGWFIDTPMTRTPKEAEAGKLGLMIAGPRFSEGRVLALARAFEQATDWHTRRPPLTPDTPVPPLKRVEGD